ncbi:glucan endo-1,3-beta-D-glucosidase-like [Cornus florida]|uniref:glucan endo-1,3-beta-D-glucosidase-like n=1 Tax=Cornus florida TaxID=4283 RepID=UPI00289B6847|nr:glucan endo-1,3-beta-D-glucosidase-like [Cornus florida]
MASDPNIAKTWVASNLVPFYPSSNIILITVGNEVMTSGDRNLMNQLLPAMQNLQNALNAASLGGKVKVSTAHSMSVLKQSDPPSSGSFDPSLGDLMKGILGFNSANGSPFTINPYPFFAYKSNPKPDVLDYALFRTNSPRVDSGNNLKYTNMFDAQVDAVRSAMNSMGFKDVEIVAAETGWAHQGDSNEAGASVENAKAYIGNLIAHLRSMVGTPLMPGKSVDTYIFALYDENLKPGPGSERAFGLFKPDLTMNYDVGLSKNGQTTKAAWCVPKIGASNAQLQANLDYACGQHIDCSPIQPGGACFEPNTLYSHAAYAMNLFYQTAGRNPWNCDFSQTAMLSSNNPSYNGCTYPGGSTNDVGQSQTSKVKSKRPKTLKTSSKLESNNAAWCVPKIGASDAQLQSNLDYACGQGIDCSPIQPGGACFEPNTLYSHAAYAMNLFYQTAGRNPWNCDFSQTAVLSVNNPSYSGCAYPGGSTNFGGLSQTSEVKIHGGSTNVGGLSQTSKTPVKSIKLESNNAAWCVPKIGTSDAQLQSNLDYACGQGIDCSPIQPGGACFEPNTLYSHAAYAMNLFYQTAGRNPWNCDFSQTAMLSSNNPSYSGCTYRGGST